jgi:trimeric autotransporter adhesin
MTLGRANEQRKSQAILQNEATTTKGTNEMKSLFSFKMATSALVSVFPFVLLALSPIAQAVVPAPDGGYPGGNTAEGQAALFSLTAGGLNNTAVGFLSLKSNTEGDFNTAVGAGALLTNTVDGNTAVGGAALLLNTIGSENTAVGAAALLHNVDGGANTATGFQALFNNAEGSGNTAHGRLALFTNTEGAFNTAVGERSLVSHITGNNNTATGASALFNDTTGLDNTATGAAALFSNTTGYSNTATGVNALVSNTIGFGNTANGGTALFQNRTGSYNTALGRGAGQSLTTGDNNVYIGALVTGVAVESNTTRIRNVYDSVANNRAVYVDAGDKIGTLSSSRRYKDDIKPMANASEAIFSLRPVSFRYKKEVDRTRSLSFGLIAEEVAQIHSDLVTPDRDGKPETVRYDAVNAMLLNEFLKEHKTVQEQDARLTRQEMLIARQQKQIEALTAGLEKVSAQRGVNKLPLKAVLNN